MISDPSIEDKTTAADLPEPHRAGAAVAAYMRRIALRLALRLWWLLLPSAACIAWGVADDLRIAIIGLMLLFLVFPFVMTLAIMNHAMRPEVVSLTRAVEFEMDDEALRLMGDEGRLIRTISRADVRSASLQGSAVEICFGRGVADILLISREYLGEERTKQIISAFAPEDMLN